MRTHETQTSPHHQPTAIKPFFGARSDQAFFSTERVAATPFFQPMAVTSSTIQAKVATTEGADLGEHVVQRMVWPIGRDDKTESNYTNLTEKLEGYTDPTGSLSEPTQEDAPFATLGERETLHLIGHGDGKGKIEGMTASELVTYLQGLGLDASKHKGTIRLISCLSGTPTPEKRLFTEMFKEALLEKGYENGVIGFNGLVRVEKGSIIKVIAPEHVPKFEELEPKLIYLNGSVIELSRKPPNSDPSSVEWQKWHQDLQALRKEAEKVHVQVVALWEPQQKDRNMSIIGVQ